MESTQKNGAVISGGLKREYDRSFDGLGVYAETLPDMQNSRTLLREGADVRIQEVGSSNFRLPLQVSFGGPAVPVEARVMGGVSLEAGKKGINMSRIIRIFYEFQDAVFDFDVLRTILERYLTDLDARQARLRLKFSIPVVQTSLRSGLDGYQYYEVVVQARLDAEGREERRIDLDYVYSSACPCSAELAEHARAGRSIYSVPHSQRSKARVSVKLKPGASLSLLELRDSCLRALQTETQVMVRRLDEQAFAELNGSYLKFVEDAARLLYRELDGLDAVADFQAACAHLESLHSHDAVATIFKGVPGGFDGRDVDYDQLIC